MRHGEPSNVGAIGFVGSLNLTCLVTGVVTFSMGASLAWTVTATVLGSLFGTTGPVVDAVRIPGRRANRVGVRSGQLRGLHASEALLSGQAMNTLTGIPNELCYLLAAPVATVVGEGGGVWYDGDGTLMAT